MPRGILVIFCIYVSAIFLLYNCGKLWNYINIGSVDPLPILPKKYVRYTTSQEMAFPLAFSIIVYTHFERFTRLLETIYREHNFYCIHVDAKAEQKFVNNVTRLVYGMGKNVFMVPNEARLNVNWGNSTILLADLTCANLLLVGNQTWKYWINLTGHEYPLRTNWELVSALENLNGYNLIAAHAVKRNNKRYPPENYLSFKVKWKKGSTLIAAQRSFVEYMLTNSRSIEILDALKRHENTSNQKIVADESYYGTLSHNPEVIPAPGSCSKEPSSSYHQTLRYLIWDDMNKPCGSGKYRHTVCLLGLLDVPILMKTHHFFANKFMPNVEPEAYNMLEAWIASKMFYEANYHQQHPSFNLTYYQELRLVYDKLECI